MDESSPKRRRIERPPSDTLKVENENDDYEPYIPVAQRRQAKLAALKMHGADSRKNTDRLSQEPEQLDGDDEEVRKRELERKERTLLVEAQEVHRKKAAQGKRI